ncbi:DNA polymerase III subunit alpha [Patescibacteria group bacterium]|nr:DNA polymerase III subunit alpha [Patescibacteria group bacterium]
MDFQHLHCHSHFSLLDGLPKIKPLVKAFKDRGFKAASLTDYGSMYGAIKFIQTCQAEEIKPILGFEAYISPRKMSDKDLQYDKDIYHLILIAENYEGYKNLMKLSSVGHLEGFFNGKPRLDKETLAKHSGGVIALSGCIRGEVPQLLKKGEIEKAKQSALEYNKIFGENNFYLELQDHPAIEGQIDVNTKLIELAKETGIPMIVSRDVHYLNPDEIDAQDILICIREGWKVGQNDREDYRHVDRSLNSAEDIISRFRHVPDAIENTIKIRDRINLEIPLDVWHFADVPIPQDKTADEALREETFKKLPNIYAEVTDEIKTRIEYELGIIKDKCYSPYFLCVADYVAYAKNNGIVETTRGSAAGSVVSYIMGITTVDPIRFKLPFERFLNPYRPSPPDVDTDFADDRRDEMIAYVTEKYGVDKVAQIITFGTMAARASVRDVGRALGLSYSFCDQVAKLIPMGAQGFPMTIERAINEEPDLKKLYNNNDDVKRLLVLARQVEGCARHTSIHAAGVVISPTPLTDFSPVQHETGGERIITQYEMKSVETAGVLKYDFLGIRNLSILGKSVEIVRVTTGDEVDIYSLPLDDKLTFEKLARGETMGLFQLGGSGMTRWLKELKPSNINDIMAMVALYRPGPMDSIPEYIRRKYSTEAIDYLDPRMEEYLDASYGLLVYQEDVLFTAIKLAGYDWLEADKFRKAIGKKIPEEMEKQKKKFFDGCRDYGKVPQVKIHRLWELIEPFAAYGFGKAHAASYGIVAYQTAYMKAHYPVQYMTAVLQAEFGDSDKVADIVHECKKMGIEVLPPDVNESFRNFAMVSKPGDSGRIRFGLSAIKNVGEHICEVIYRQRKENGQYQNLEDFLKRVDDKDLNKKSIESLVKSGALDCFGYDRNLLLSNTENIQHYIREHREIGSSNQNSLFFGTNIALDDKVVLRPAPEATLDDKLIWEKELLGLYVSSHPFAYYQKVMQAVITPLDKVEEQKRDGWVVIGGVVDSLKKKITKKGSVMMFVTLQDESGSIDLLVFPKTYEKTLDIWKEGNVVCVVGKTPKEEGDNKVFVEKASLLDKESALLVCNQLSYGLSVRDYAPQAQEKSVVISLTKQELKQKTEELKSLFIKYPGEYKVFVMVEGKTIRAQTTIDWHSGVLDDIEALIGDGKIEVFE